MGSVAKSFYGRRVVRIFPAYYVAILIFAIAGLSSEAGGLWWDAAYLSNFKIALIGDWPAHVAHFWSLAVEEQFYLFWPFVILFFPRRFLFAAILTAIGIAPLARLTLYVVTRNNVATSVQMISCLDCLAAGALLAWVWSRGEREKMLAWRRVSLIIAAIAGAAVFTYSQILMLPFSLTLSEVSGNFLYAVLFFWVIDAAASGLSGRLGVLLQSAPALAIGRISYGMYVYHVMAIELLKNWGVETGGMFVAATTMTLAFAIASWMLIERPMNSLKRFFPYVKRVAISESSAVPKPHAKYIDSELPAHRLIDNSPPKSRILQKD